MQSMNYLHKKIIVEDSSLGDVAYCDWYRYGEAEGSVPMVVYIGGAINRDQYLGRMQSEPIPVIEEFTNALSNLGIKGAIDLLVCSYRPLTMSQETSAPRAFFNLLLYDFLPRTSNPRPTSLSLVGYSLGAYLAAYLLFNLASAKSLATLGGCGMAMALTETGNPQLENKHIVSFSNKGDGAEDEDRDFTNILAEYGIEYGIIKRSGHHFFADYSANGSVEDAFRHAIYAHVPHNQEDSPGKDYVDLFRSGFLEPHAWVMFANGTSVAITDSTDSVEQQAKRAMAKTYPSETHLDLEDVGVCKLDGDRGWLVTSKNPCICNIVLFDTVGIGNCEDTLNIAFYAKKLRRQDWIDRRVIHIEPAKTFPA